MYTHLTYVAAVAVSFSAHAQPFEIVSSTIDGGGGAIAGSTYQITGSVGQSDVGPTLSGTTYELAGGFIATLGTTAGRLCADQNGDGLVTPTDFTAWIGNYNTNNLIADVNQDGSVTPTDFTAWISAFNLGVNGPICSLK